MAWYRAVPVKTFKQIYCEEHRCQPPAFFQKIFWRCLPPLAIPFVPFVGGMQSGYFDADRELIRAVGTATSMAEVRDEIRDYFSHPQNRGWLRRVWNIRVSTHRLKRLARLYLQDPGVASSRRVEAESRRESNSRP